MHMIDLLFYLTSLYRNREIPNQSELISAYVIVIELDDACSKQYIEKPHVVHSHARLGADSMALRDLLAYLYVALTCIPKQPDPTLSSPFCLSGEDKLWDPNIFGYTL